MADKSSLKDIFLSIGVFFGLALNLLMWIFVYFKVKPSSELVALHYNIYSGIDLIGEWWKFYTIPAIGFFIYATNQLLAKYCYRREKILSYMLVAAHILIQLYLMWALFLIIKFI